MCDYDAANGDTFNSWFTLWFWTTFVVIVFVAVPLGVIVSWQLMTILSLSFASWIILLGIERSIRNLYEAWIINHHEKQLKLLSEQKRHDNGVQTLLNKSVDK